MIAFAQGDEIRVVATGADPLPDEAQGYAAVIDPGKVSAIRPAKNGQTGEADRTVAFLKVGTP